MKRKKGFTLIELLAIIVILAIIAVITVPIILNVIENSKKGAAMNSAYGYKEAIQKYYLSNYDKIPVEDFTGEFAINENGSITNGIETHPIPIEGTIPTNGYIVLDKAYIKSGCVQINDYAVTLENGKVKETKKEMCDTIEIEIVEDIYTQVEDNNPGIICGEDDTEDDSASICYIYSIEDLIQFSNQVNNEKNFQNKTVNLMNNLDITDDKSYVNPSTKVFGDVNENGTIETLKEELNNQETKGFPTIGKNSTKFKGTFNGLGKRINGIYINSSTTSNIGLFNSNQGTIKNLALSDITVIGLNNVGALAGTNEGTVNSIKIINGYVDGNENVAGACGINYGPMNGALVNANITGTTNVGLAAGYAQGNSLYAIVSGNITAKENSNKIGGIIGVTAYREWYSPTFKGIYLNGEITNCASNCHRTIGSQYTTDRVETAALESIKVNNDTITTDISYDGNGYTVNQKTLDTISIYESFFNTYIGGNGTKTYYFDFNKKGNIDIYNIETNPISVTLDGEGTSENPYQINNYNELKQISYNLSAHYILNNNIDFNNQKNHLMLSSEKNPFTGKLNGNDKTISNVNIEGISSLGLFGKNTGTISGLKINNIRVYGKNDNIGGLLGINGGRIEGIKILSGNIEGRNNVGVLVGNNAGAEGTYLKTTYVDGTVKGKENVGIAAGYSNSTTFETIVSGNVIGKTDAKNIGGIVGKTVYRDYGKAAVYGVFKSGNVTYDSCVENCNRTIGSPYTTDNVKTVALNTIEVNGTAPENDNLKDVNGYSITSYGIKNIAVYEDFLDTYMGGIGSKNFYYDFDSNGNIDLYSKNEKPIEISLDGSGTSANPYQINNYNELKQISYNLSAHYILNNNIDFNNQQNPIMLSSEKNPFTGEINGNDKTISNVNIEGIGSIGLFGKTTGTISGLKINSISVYGKNDNVGGLVGINGGRLEGIKILGGNVEGRNYVGVLVGNNAGASGTYLKTTYVDGTVKGKENIGIAAGYSNSTTFETIVSGNVIGKTDAKNIGGIVGKTVYRDYGKAAVYGVFKSGNVTYDSCVENCNRTIGSPYTTDNVKTVALNTIEVNGTAPENDNLKDVNGYSITSYGIKNIAVYEDFLDTYMGGIGSKNFYYDFDSNGNIDLYSKNEKPIEISLDGSGTSANPYQIKNYSDLKQITYNPSANYKLMDDINYSNQTNPLILSSEKNPFRGVFQGNNKTISNVNIEGIGSLGLFGKNTGTIRDLTINTINTSGKNDYISGIAGLNTGTIKGVKLLNGTIDGRNYVGGIAGHNTGTIQAVMINANVSGKENVALGTGYTNGTTFEAVVSGNLTGKTNAKNIGGLAGYTQGREWGTASVHGAFINGSVTANSCSENCNRTIGYEYANDQRFKTGALETITPNTNAGITNPNGASYTSTELQTISTYSNLGMNTASNSGEYRWLIDNNAITFTKN